MEWTETERGGRKLLLDGYIYVKKRNLADGWESYECELRRNRQECKARIKVKVSGGNEFRETTEHNHPPDHGRANANKLKFSIKRMALETDDNPKQILMTTMQQATKEGIRALPELDNIRRSIRRQRQDSREAIAMDIIVNDKGNFEGRRSIKSRRLDRQKALRDERVLKNCKDREDNRPVAVGEAYLMAHPGLNASQTSTRSQKVLDEEIMARNCGDVEDNGSVVAGDGLMTQQGIWKNIRRWHQDIQEAYDVRRAEEDKSIDAVNRPSVVAEEDSMALPVISNVKSLNQDDIQEASESCRNSDIKEQISEDQISPTTVEQDSHQSIKSIQRQRQDSREAMATDIIVKDQGNFEGKRAIKSQRLDSQRALQDEGVVKNCGDLDDNRPGAAEEVNLMAHPGLNDSQTSISSEWQDGQKALKEERMVGNCEDVEGIWRNIRQWHQDIQEAYDVRRAEEDQSIDAVNRPSLVAEEDSMALPVISNVNSLNQDDIEEASGSCRNSDIKEQVSEDQISPTTVEEYSHPSIKSEPEEISLTDWYDTFTTQKNT